VVKQYALYPSEFIEQFKAVGIETDGSYNPEKLARFLEKIKPILFPDAVRAENGGAKDDPAIAAKKLSDRLKNSNMSENDKIRVRRAYEGFSRGGGTAAQTMVDSLASYGYKFDPASGDVQAVGGTQTPFMPEQSSGDVIPVGNAIRGASKDISHGLRNISPIATNAVNQTSEALQGAAKTGVEAAKALPRAGQVLKDRRKNSGVTY